jgi:hypothetical protein
MMTFSLSPTSGSEADSSAASVSTRVVSWNDAADSHESVASDALVIPISSGRAAAGWPPSARTRSFSLLNRTRSMLSPGRNVVSPASTTFTRRNICRTISSTCLSWIGTPCER